MAKRKYQVGHQQEGKGDAQEKKKPKFNQPGKGKKKGFFKKMKNMSKLKCYNCGGILHVIAKSPRR